MAVTQIFNKEFSSIDPSQYFFYLPILYLSIYDKEKNLHSVLPWLYRYSKNIVVWDLFIFKDIFIN